MKKFKRFELKLWHALLPLSVIAVIIFAVLFVFPEKVGAWSRINNLNGSIKISDDGNVIAFIATRADSGDKVLVLGNDGNRIWDSSPEKSLTNMALSGNGKYMAVIGKGVYLLSIAEKKTLWSNATDGGMTVAINSDGTWTIVGGYSSTITAFKKESSTAAQKWDLGFREDRPKAVAISGDGTLAAASTNKSFYVFDTNSSAIKWKATTKEYIQNIKISSDGKYLLGIAAHSIYYWDKNSSTPLWKKEWKGLLIGADMSSSGDKIAVSSQKEVVVLNSSGTELRHFENSFGNSDLVMSENGRYIYVNSGSRRLYAFDDSYSSGKLRPFRIIKDVNSGGHSKTVVGSGVGNLVTYPAGDNINFEQINPSILAIHPDVPLLIKDGIMDMGMFITNPTLTSQKLVAEVRLSLPISAAWWTSITGQVTARDPSDVKSKLLNYAIDNLVGSSKVRTEKPTIAAGSSQEFDFTINVPDLASGTSFADQLASGLSSLSPASLISQVLGKIKGPLAKLVGDGVADTAISVTSRTITAAAGEMVFPTLGMGTTTLYDEKGKVYDQDSFYFIYLR